MQEQDLWVFGYGSLLWKPGFTFVERRLAVLHGYTRSFCMRSLHYRGTDAHPGLVLALDPQAGGCCHGVGFRVAAPEAAETLAYLRERELISDAYIEERCPIRFRDGQQAEAVCYVINRDHVQYSGVLDLAEQAAIIASAAGSVGPNDEYLFNTVAHLHELGIADDELSQLAEMVKAAKAGTRAAVR